MICVCVGGGGSQFWSLAFPAVDCKPAHRGVRESWGSGVCAWTRAWPGVQSGADEQYKLGMLLFWYCGTWGRDTVGGSPQSGHRLVNLAKNWDSALGIGSDRAPGKEMNTRIFNGKFTSLLPRVPWDSPWIFLGRESSPTIITPTVKQKNVQKSFVWYQYFHSHNFPRRLPVKFRLWDLAAM